MNNPLFNDRLSYDVSKKYENSHVDIHDIGTNADNIKFDTRYQKESMWGK